MQYALNLQYGVVNLSLRQSREIANYLESAGARSKLLIVETVYSETLKNIWNTTLEASTIARIGIPYTIRGIAQQAIFKFVDFAERRRVPDNLDKMPVVEKMYRDMWANPKNDGVKKRWAEIKKRQVAHGPPSGPDLVILSTAAKYQEKFGCELLTCDNDFLLFQDIIQETLAIKVRNAFRLPRTRFNRSVKY